jgi:hypothetical protein
VSSLAHGALLAGDISALSGYSFFLNLPLALFASFLIAGARVHCVSMVLSRGVMVKVAQS